MYQSQSHGGKYAPLRARHQYVLDTVWIYSFVPRVHLVQAVTLKAPWFEGRLAYLMARIALDELLSFSYVSIESPKLSLSQLAKIRGCCRCRGM